MSRSSLSLSTDAVLSRWMVDVVVARSWIGAFGEAVPVTGAGGSAWGPTNTSDLAPEAEEEQEAWALRSASCAGDAPAVAGVCAVTGRAAGSSRIDAPLSPDAGGTFLYVDSAGIVGETFLN